MIELSPQSQPRSSETGDLSPYFASGDGRFILYQGDCRELLTRLPAESFDLIFADPPYFLSNSGITCRAGRMVSVNKGTWDRSKGLSENYRFTKSWLAECQKLLKPNGAIWVSGTSHIIHLVGFAMDELGYKVLNDITWVKPNPPPNLSCRYFTHATESLIWAGRDKMCRHKFNYALMKRLNGGKQMTSVWVFNAPQRNETIFGKHPTQKPLGLLERIIAASTDENEIVLDPFSGSATTGIAAARMNRRFMGIELEITFLDLGVLRFDGVPQADDPNRIIDIVVSNAPKCTVSEIALAHKLTERQVHYYRQAGKFLGLLERTCADWHQTDIGRAIATATRRDAEILLCRQMVQTPLYFHAARVAAKCRSAEKRYQAVSNFLGVCTSLGETTRQRRAQTLLSWMAWVEDRQLLLDGNITPAV